MKLKKKKVFTKNRKIESKCHENVDENEEEKEKSTYLIAKRKNDFGI